LLTSKSFGQKLALASVPFISLGSIAFALHQPHNFQAPRIYGSPKLVCSLVSTAITESSGMAPSRQIPGQFYTHNDSGDTARFFRFRLDGTVTGQFTLIGITAIDWEDMASARVGEANYLYFADIGDNGQSRPFVTIYRLQEPIGSGGNITQYDAIRLTYPTGPRNAETLLVHPTKGDIYIVTKSETEASRVFWLPHPSAGGQFAVNQLGQVQVGTSVPGSKLITGGSISPDARYVTLRTYWDGYDFRITGGFQTWPKATPKRFAIAAETQGESLCYALDGSRVYTTSEGNPCRVSEVPLGKAPPDGR